MASFEMNSNSSSSSNSNSNSNNSHNNNNNNNCCLSSISITIIEIEEILSLPNYSLLTTIIKLENKLNNYKLIKNKLINNNKELENILKRCKNRNIIDKKVPPGSSLVQRNIINIRFLLCLLCINIGLVEEFKGNTQPTIYSESILSFREALMWFPKSIEAGYLFGITLRHLVSDINQFEFVQEIWEKAYQNINSIVIPQTCNCNYCQNHYQHFNDCLISRERDASNKVKSSLILHYCQQGRLDLATPLLISGRFLYVLSQEILHYSFPSFTNHLKYSIEENINNKDNINNINNMEIIQSSIQTNICTNAMGIDNILPIHLLQSLQYIFRPTSPFWSEHSYDFFSNASRSVGYFSYLYHFKDYSARNIIEQVIDQVYSIVIQKFPEVETDSTVAEWWVHSRPHSCGHQFHFDSDETAIYAGKSAQHPIISCVIYLSPDIIIEINDESNQTTHQEIRNIGGPTVVTDQTLQSEGLATHGFMFHPKENRLVAFDAKYLHGVIPGRGVCPGPPESRRVTFMVGFWKKIQAVTRMNDEPGPGQPFPNLSTTNYTWPYEMEISKISNYTTQLNNNNNNNNNNNEQLSCKIVLPTPVKKIWQPVTIYSNDEVDSNNNSSNSNDSGIICAPYNSCFQGF